MLTPSEKGSVAEAAIVHAAIKRGVVVAKPVNEGVRYDLIFELGPKLLRVQCKWALRRGDVIAVRCYSSRRNRDGFVKTSYTAEQIDAIAAYCPELDRCYFLPLGAFPGTTAVQLRLGPPRNHQRRRVLWAEEFEFDARLGPTITGP